MALSKDTSSWFKGMPACSQYFSARLAQPPYLSKRPVLKYPPQLPTNTTGSPTAMWFDPETLVIITTVLSSIVPSPSGILFSWSMKYANCS